MDDVRDLKERFVHLDLAVADQQCAFKLRQLTKVVQGNQHYLAGRRRASEYVQETEDPIGVEIG